MPLNKQTSKNDNGIYQMKDKHSLKQDTTNGALSKEFCLRLLALVGCG